MSNTGMHETNFNDTAFASQVGLKSALKLRARRNPNIGVWTGLGVTGMIGWSVAAPTVLGIALGRWMDGRHWTDHSCTLAMLAVGLALGCANAWRWVVKEDRELRMEQEEAGD